MKAATFSLFFTFCIVKFQSTPPVKAATQLFMGLIGALPISIHAAREGGDDSIGVRNKLPRISIHAAREGGDDKAAQLRAEGRHFNPRRP